MANPKRRKARKTMKARGVRGDDSVVEVPVVPVSAIGIAPKTVKPVTKKAARKPKNKVKAKE